MTAVTVILKLTDVAAAGTVTEVGNATAGLLLDKLTPTPALGAGAVSDTVHASEADPTTVVLVHWMLCNVAAVVPVPVVVLPCFTVTEPHPDIPARLSTVKKTAANPEAIKREDKGNAVSALGEGR